MTAPATAGEGPWPGRALEPALPVGGHNYSMMVWRALALSLVLYLVGLVAFIMIVD